MLATKALAMRSTAIRSIKPTQQLAMRATSPQAIATPIILVGAGLIGA